MPGAIETNQPMHTKAMHTNGVTSVPETLLGVNDSNT
jgi:hypothetical protein